MKAGSPIHRQDRVKAYIICRILPVMWKFTVLPFQACTVSKEFTKDSKRKQNNNKKKKKSEKNKMLGETKRASMNKEWYLAYRRWNYSQTLDWKLSHA